MKKEEVISKIKDLKSIFSSNSKKMVSIVKLEDALDELKGDLPFSAMNDIRNSYKYLNAKCSKQNLKIREDIENIQENECWHEYEYDGYDSHKSYEKCKFCGKEISS